MKSLAILEGILFVVGEEGVSLKTISDIMHLSETEVKSLLTQLKDEYDNENRGLKICYLADTFKLSTKTEYKEYYKNLVDQEEINNLTPATLETLAIIAYNGPITRMEIDELRGVNSSHLLRKLIARDLIKRSGKSDLPGHPNLYEITNDFLDYFGLATINDLPKLDTTREENEEDLYTSMYKEEN